MHGSQWIIFDDKYRHRYHLWSVSEGGASGTGKWAGESVSAAGCKLRGTGVSEAAECLPAN